MINVKKFIGSLTSVGALSVLFLASNTYAATWDPGRIIDDAVFTSKDSMSVRDIQGFLNSKVPTCDTNHVAGPSSQGATPPWTCLKDYYENTSNNANNLNGAPIPAGAISAAQIIWNNAQAFNISPRVLIVTLQKENGLITDTWPYPWQYRTAMGFACPDTAACDPNFYGFAKQVYQAARHFKNFYDENPTWTVPYKVGVRTIAYSPDSSCGSSSVNIVTHGTAALYSYTPYQPNAGALAAGFGTAPCGAYGNRNFWLYYNDWFGSTLFPQPAGGNLYSEQSTGKVYLVTEGTKYYIPSYEMMLNYGIDGFPIAPATDAMIAGFTDGGVLTTLIQDSGGVYLVNNRVRHHLTPGMCAAWAFSCSDPKVVLPLGATFQQSFLAQGGDVTQLIVKNNIIYKIVDGKKLPVANNQSLLELGLSGIGILVANTINSNQTLGPLLITTPTVINFSPNQAIYYFDGTTYYLVPDFNVYDDWALSKAPRLALPTSSYNSLGATPPSTPLSVWNLAADGGTKSIIDKGRAITIPAGLADAFSANTFVAGPTNILSSLAKSILQPTAYADPQVLIIAGGKKHHVPTYDDYIALGLSPATTTVLRPERLASVPQGNDALGDGKIVSIQNDPKLYVVSKSSLLHVADPNTFAAYGFSYANIPVYQSTLTTDYPISPTDLVYGVTPDNNYYLVNANKMFKLSAETANDFGLKTTSFSSIAANVIKSTVSSGLSKFIYNSDEGKIYYASGGAIHYVANYSSYIAYGGNRTSASVVNTATIKLFLEAQPI